MIPRSLNQVNNIALHSWSNINRSKSLLDFENIPYGDYRFQFIYGMRELLDIKNINLIFKQRIAKADPH